MDQPHAGGTCGFTPAVGGQQELVWEAVAGPSGGCWGPSLGMSPPVLQQPVCASFGGWKWSLSSVRVAGVPVGNHRRALGHPDGSGFHPGEGAVVEIADWYLLVGKGLSDVLL